MRALAVLSLVVVALLATATAVRADVPQDGAHANPLIFVSKKVKEYYIVSGNKVEVTVVVSNYGQSPAFNIKITNPHEQEKVNPTTVPQLAFGENATMTYTVTPSELGEFKVGVAEVFYTLQPDSTEALLAKSNIIREEKAYFRGEQFDDETFRGTLSVVSQDRYNRMHTRYIKETIAYVFLCALPAAFPLVMYRLKQNQVDYLLHRSKKTK